MSVYINVNKLLKRLPDDLPYKGSVRRVLMQTQPADVVEVVRCKDCKLRDTEDCPMMVWDCGELMGETKDNDYCSYGERRTH